LLEHGNLDSRRLRKLSGLDTKEDKKEYEKSLVELQNQGDVVITGAKENDTDSGWSSMCYELSEQWLQSIPISGQDYSMEEANDILREELTKTCSTNAYKYFAKKLRL